VAQPCLLITCPVIIGSSLWAATYLLAVSNGLAGTRPAWFLHTLSLGPIVLSATGFACLFRFVPHTVVRWRDAITGGLLAGIAFELGKHAFGIYLANVPTYRTIYGSFAPLLAFLVWVYYSWLVMLAAALICASLRRAGAQPARRPSRA
jgi:membrane protein